MLQGEPLLTTVMKAMAPAAVSMPRKYGWLQVCRTVSASGNMAGRALATCTGMCAAAVGAGVTATTGIDGAAAWTGGGAANLGAAV